MHTILIIEDSPTHMRLAVMLLERAGYNVLQAPDGETGVQLAQEKLPDIILSDIRLPGIDGLEATRILKKDDRTKAIPVVMISSYTTECPINEVYAAGALGIITKPFHYSDFLRVIGKALAGDITGVH